MLFGIEDDLNVISTDERRPGPISRGPLDPTGLDPVDADHV